MRTEPTGTFTLHEAVLGPLPCIACGRLLVWGNATHCIPALRHEKGVDYVRRRDLYDHGTGRPHRCTAQVKAA